MTTVSLISITIDSDRMLRRTLQSVASQTYPAIEHIVVDSRPGQRRLKEEFPRVRFENIPRSGVYSAINYGLSLATGDIVGLIHGNDALASDDVIARIAAEFDQNPELDFVYGDIRFVSPRDFRARRLMSGARFEPSLLPNGIVPPHPSLYMRRELAEKIGPYATKYIICGDFDMWIRLFSDSSLRYKYMPLVVANMTTGGLSTSLRGRLWITNREKLDVLRSHNLPASPLRLLKKYIFVLKSLLRP